MSENLPKSIHACAIVLGNKGLLITGKSGSGKSFLARNLIDTWHKKGLFARWVSDDRVIIKQSGDNLIASAPDNISGLSELRYCGIEIVTPQKKSVLDMLVELVPVHELERLPIRKFATIANHDAHIQKIAVPINRHEESVMMIAKQLDARFMDIT